MTEYGFQTGRVQRHRNDIAMEDICLGRLRVSIADGLMVLGLLLTVAGAWLGAWGVSLTPKQAIAIGVSRFNGENDEENLKLPAVQSLLSQSRMAEWGFYIIAIGTLFQIGGVVAGRRTADRR